jgi:hypothetical protein
MSAIPRYWLSYGGGVNSTALAILLVTGALPQYEPFDVIFADTGEEETHTYLYIKEHFEPWLRGGGHDLVIVRPKESVLERWERLHVTGSRLIRACTVEGKINPIRDYIKANGGGESLIGIDAGEAHRSDGKIRPLVDLDIDREECIDIIKDAGLPVPGKSGCWCCPFKRVSDVLMLVSTDPCRAYRIERLEHAATEMHGLDSNGNPRTQWSDKPVAYWMERARQGDMFYEVVTPGVPCECYDG